MATPLSVVQDEFQIYVKKFHSELTAHLPHPGLAELAESFAIEPEEFWEQKYRGYFPNQPKSENKSFETSFQKKLKLLVLAVEWRGSALRHAGPDAKNNPEIVKLAVSRNGRELEIASERLRDDPEIVMLVVTRFWAALEFASERLRDDPEIVKLAVAQYGFALEFASKRLRNNRKIIIAAIKTCPDAMRFAGNKFSSNQELLNASFCLQVLLCAALVGGGIALIVTAISLTAGVGIIAAGVTAGTFFACRKFNTRRAFQEAEKMTLTS